jgi:hypothetical protein
MEARQVKVSDVHQFLVSFFQSEHCIPEAPDLTKMFNIVTEAKLWRYDHYGPLAEIAETFLPDDKDPARKLVSMYKDQLSGFFVATKIIDFIDLSKLDDPDDDSSDDSNNDSEDENHQSLSRKEYKKIYRELKVTLKLDRTIKFSIITMSYVETLWKSLIKEFNLPPLTAIINKIIGGSLIISWLVPPQVSSVIATSYSKALGFYRQHNIVQVQLDSHTLYHEEWIVSCTCVVLCYECVLLTCMCILLMVPYVPTCVWLTSPSGSQDYSTLSEPLVKKGLVEPSPPQPPPGRKGPRVNVNIHRDPAENTWLSAVTNFSEPSSFFSRSITLVVTRPPGHD